VMAHPKVRSCVIVGLRDPEFGQRIHAILQLTAGVDAQSVIDGMGVFLSDHSGATSMRKVLRSSASAHATIPARFAVP
jgi:acyl-coenzyme A synthetase/AMP-(fatty) acid ligase